MSSNVINHTLGTEIGSEIPEDSGQPKPKGLATTGGRIEQVYADWCTTVGLSNANKPAVRLNG